MKKLLSLCSLICLIASLPASAETVIIKGDPITLEKQGEVYVTPQGYTASGDYTYAVVDGTKTVCYTTKQNFPNELTAQTINVTVGGQTVSWNCYQLNPAYFTVQP